MPIDDFERRHPLVLHARLGAEIARDEFHIDDERVLDAIRRHTVAGTAMTPLDCVVFLADGLEPGRDFHDRAIMADLALRDLNAAMRTTLHSTTAYLRGRGLEPAPQSLAALALFAREAHA
jgi:predicted HD superfamily hydrolase involved in NAD metabolism